MEELGLVGNSGPEPAVPYLVLGPYLPFPC